MSEKQTEGVPAVGFLVMAFTEEKAADATLNELKRAKSQRQFYFEDAAVITQNAKGKVHYHETGDMHTGEGAGIGALVGGVLGILGGPAGIALGAGAGAAVGALATAKDSGFSDESLKTVGGALKPGTSALSVITSHAFLKAVRKEVPVEETRVMVNNLATEISSKLEEGKNMALGFILAEDGLAIKEVAVSEESAEVFGIVVTDDGVVAGAALATAAEVDYEIGVATEEGTVVEAGVITEDQAVIVDYVEMNETTEDDPTVDEESG